MGMTGGSSARVLADRTSRVARAPNPARDFGVMSFPDGLPRAPWFRRRAAPPRNGCNDFRPAAGRRSGRKQVELPRPVLQDHFEVAGLPDGVLEFDLDTTSRPTRAFDLGLGAHDPAQNFDRFRLLARALLPPSRREALLDSELRPGGQTLPDLVLVSALERLQNLLEGRSGHRLPVGPDDGGEVGA